MKSQEDSSAIDVTYNGKTILIPRVGASQALAEYIWFLYADCGIDGTRIAKTLKELGFLNLRRQPWGRTSASDLCLRHLGHTLTGVKRPRKQAAQPSQDSKEIEAAGTLELMEYTLTLQDLSVTKRLDMVRRLIA